MRYIVVAVLLAATLAGCAENGSAAPEETDSISEELQETLVATETTGVIRGLVLTETFEPIANATVRIVGTELSMQSNDKGEFGFGDLDPATYFIEVTKVGFNSTQTSTIVEAGIADPTIVKVTLLPNPSTLPKVIPFEWTGFIYCSVRSPAIGMPCTQGYFGDDDIDKRYPLDGVPDWAQGEMTWESTQALGGEMSYNWRKTGTNNDYIDIEGKSPLTLQADAALLGANNVGAGQPLRQIIFTAHLEETEPPAGGLWGVGLQVDQQFTVYTHVFYNHVPDPDWRFLTDGKYVLPS